VANKRVNLSSAAVQLKYYKLQVVMVVRLPLGMVNPFVASNVVNLGTRRLIVPQGRRGMVVPWMNKLVAWQ
jgi:hypothetical protein